MRDALTVSFIQGVGNLDRRLQRLVERQRAPAQPPRQRLALQMLHHQEVDPVLAPHIMERTDVWVIQAGDGLGFALEPLLQVGV